MKSRCSCGRVKSRYANYCNRCHDERLKRATAEASKVVQSGHCPDCNAGLKRNLAMAGWWQCEQYGAEGFRKDASKPSCSFQCFTA